MSGAIGTAIMGGLAATVVGSILAPDQQAQAAPAVVNAPQASKLPDQAAVRSSATGAGQIVPGAGGIPGTSTGTLLTGAGGVDAGGVKLGKNSALGS
jgi:hypothetical protein